jgi:hypothetical protein
MLQTPISRRDLGLVGFLKHPDTSPREIRQCVQTTAQRSAPVGTAKSHSTSDVSAEDVILRAPAGVATSAPPAMPLFRLST